MVRTRSQKKRSIDEGRQSVSRPGSTQNKFTLRNFFTYYLNNSTIHGTKYIGEGDNWFTKFFWIIALVTSIILCAYVLYTTYMKWQFRPDIGFTKKLTPVQTIPFPTLTICPQTKAKKSLVSFEHCFRRRFEKTEVHGKSYDESIFFESLLHVCDPQLLKHFTFDDVILNGSSEIVEELKKTLYSLDDSMMFCKWRDSLVRCSKFFNEILTDQGICFSFNMLDYKEMFRGGNLHKDFEMFNNGRSGNWTLDGGYLSDNLNAYPFSIISHQYDGLRLILKIRDSDMDSTCRGSNQGFRIFWNMPGEIPNALSSFLFVPIEQDVTISMKPLKSETAKNLLKYPPKIRQCFMERERKLKYLKTYTKSNCEMECLTNYTLTACGCVKFSMPRESESKICTATELKCVLETEREWLSLGTDEQCDCMPACTEISFEATLRQTNFDHQRMFRSFGYDLSNAPGAVMSRLSIYIENSDFEATERYSVFDSMDFLSSCGGLLGLFMGFSILSLIELGYYFMLWLSLLRKPRSVEPAPSVPPTPPGTAKLEYSNDECFVITDHQTAWVR